MPRHKYFHSPSRIIRLALQHAIDDREAMIDAQYDNISGTWHDKEYAIQCKRELHDFRMMLKLRYGIGEMPGHFVVSDEMEQP